MNVVSDMQPPSSETPLIGTYFSCIMIMVASSVVSVEIFFAISVSIKLFSPNLHGLDFIFIGKSVVLLLIEGLD